MKRDPIMDAKLDELWCNGYADELRYYSDMSFNNAWRSCVLGACLVFGLQFANTIVIKPLLYKLKEKKEIILAKR